MVSTPVLWKSQTQANTTDAAAAGGAPDQQDGQIVGLADGGYLVVWADFSRVHNTNGTAILGQRYDAQGQKVGGETIVGAASGGDLYSPNVAALPNGNILVAFVETFGSNSDILVHEYDPNLNHIAIRFVDFTASQTIGPAVTGFADGSYLASYTLGSGADTDIAARRVVPATGPGSQFDIENDTDNRGFSQLVTLSNGNFVAVYQDEASGSATNIDVKFRIMTAVGGSVTGPAIVAGAGDTAAETAPDIAVLKSGGFVVVWTDSAGDADGSGIRATIYNNAGTATVSDFRINTSQTGIQENATVLGLADGSFLVSWNDVNAGLVRAQRFDAAGNTVGIEFTVKNGVAGTPEAALLSDGRIAYALDDLSTGDYDVVTSIWTLDGGVNEAPTITSDGGGATATKLLVENHTAVTTVAAADPNAGTSIVYSISGGADAAKFQINASTGALRFITAPNFEASTDADGNNSYVVTVSASDGSLSDTQTITVNVTDRIEGTPGDHTPTLWKLESQVNTTDAAAASGIPDQRDAQITGLADGGYLVVWTDYSRVHNTIGAAVLGQRYNALGEKVGAQKIVDQTGDATVSNVTAMAGGGIAVAYVETFGATTFISVSEYDANLNFLAIRGVDTEFNKKVDPAITGFADGSYLVSYTLGTGADTDIVARRVVPSVGVGAQFDIENDTDNRGFSQLATLSNGNFVVVYQDEASGSATDIDVKFRIMTAVGGLVTGPAIVAGAGDTAAETAPDVAVLKGGGFVVVWTDSAGDANGSGIRATIYNNAGTVTVSDFQVNTSQTGIQENATVLALADGGFLVSWNDVNADLVRAQRFDAAGNKVGIEFTVKEGVAGTPEAASLLDGRIAYAFEDASSGDYDIVTSIWTVNEAPTAVVLNNTVASIAENASTASRIKVADIAVTDDAFGINALALAGADASYFEIIGTELFLKAGTVLDFETKTSYAVAITADDSTVTGTPDAISATFTLNITNVNETPSITSDSGGTTATKLVFENTTAVTTVTASDPDAGTTLTYSISGGADAAKFQIDAATGALRFITVPDFQAPADADQNNSYVVTVRASDGSLFDEQTITVFVTDPQHNDFNGDARSDVLWRHDAGNVGTWTMNGAQILSTGSFTNAPPDWKIQGTGDFNGDGKADLLWRHDSGLVGTWHMNGLTVISTQAFANAPLTWHVQGTGDINGDGKDDLIWRHDDGTVGVWFMNGATIISTQAFANAPNSWKLEAVGDFNGDGKDDLLWRNSDGTVGTWHMNGAQIISTQAFANAPNDWHLEGVGDFNGDGKDDMLWRHDSGLVGTWHMNGATIISTQAFANAPTSWHIEDVGDYNGDNKDDILWRHDDGTVAAWLMNGAQVTSTPNYGAIPNDWHIIGNQYQFI
jgi:hypothetical protein